MILLQILLFMILIFDIINDKKKENAFLPLHLNQEKTTLTPKKN